jgi:TolB-like protein/Flp pilus assembly protein TadD
MNFFEELKRRNVVRVGLLYAVGGWLILQVADVLVGLLSLPDWTLRFVALLLVLGFPLVLIFSWVFELTPEGLKRERDLVRDPSLPDAGAKKLNQAIGGLLVIAVVLLIADLTVHAPDTSQPLPASVPPTEPVIQAATQSTDRKDSTENAPATSIAVLPFTNMSSDPENDYFADGLSEELLNVLAQIEGFKVAGRTSSFAFKGENLNLQEIGRTLNVGTVLEGSVRKSGDQVRITAQLINISDGYHLWSNSYDRKLDDIFSIQDDIARQVVSALKKTLLASQDEVVLDRRPTDNLQAYQLYLRGRHQLAKRTRQGLGLALDAFREAAALDPNFARAWTGIADAQSLMASYGYEPISNMKNDAEFAIARALELEPELGEAYASKGLLLSQLDWSTADIIALYRKALELNPNNSLAHMWLAGQLGLSDPKAAMEHLRTAYALDPLSGVVIFNLANFLMVSGQNDEARQHTEELLQLDPGWPGAQRLLAQNAFLTGDSYASIQAYLRVLELDPNDTQTMENLAASYLSLGDLETAENYVRRARAQSPDYAGTAALEAYLLALRGKLADGLKITRDMAARRPEDKRALANAIFAETLAQLPERALALCRVAWGAQLPPGKPSMDDINILPPCIHALRTSGNTEQARVLADEGAATINLALDSYDTWTLHYAAAQLAAAAGDRDTALSELRIAIRQNMAPLVFPLEPWMQPYRDDPDFKPLFDGLARQADQVYARLTADGMTSGRRVSL